ncbi:MAG: TIM barrel protein [Planctomycetota bacterium]
MLWGYANGWYPEFLECDEDELYAKLKFLLAHDLQETSVALPDVLAMSDQERDRLGKFLEDNDLHLTPQVWFDYVNADEGERERRTQEIVTGLREHVGTLRAWSVFTKAGCGHRFDRAMPVEEKINRLCAALKPIAAACHELGTPLAINNQGDFYAADFVEMCERTPHLRLHVDTANIFWACERILPAFRRMAPHVVGTHWRDERVEIGSRKPRGVLLHNCVTGRGDVPLRQCFELLKQEAPNPDRLVMELEMFGPREMDNRECLAESLKFVRSLREDEE